MESLVARHADSIDQQGVPVRITVFARASGPFDPARGIVGLVQTTEPISSRFPGAVDLRRGAPVCWSEARTFAAAEDTRALHHSHGPGRL